MVNFSHNVLCLSSLKRRKCYFTLKKCLNVWEDSYIYFGPKLGNVHIYQLEYSALTIWDHLWIYVYNDHPSNWMNFMHKCWSLLFLETCFPYLINCMCFLPSLISTVWYITPAKLCGILQPKLKIIYFLGEQTAKPQITYSIVYFSRQTFTFSAWFGSHPSDDMYS